MLDGLVCFFFNIWRYLSCVGGPDSMGAMGATEDHPWTSSAKTKNFRMVKVERSLRDWSSIIPKIEGIDWRWMHALFFLKMKRHLFVQKDNRDFCGTKKSPYFWVDDFPLFFWWDRWTFPGEYVLVNLKVLELAGARQGSKSLCRHWMTSP